MSVLDRSLQTLSQNLFPFEKPLTRGEQLHFRLFELMIALCSLRLAWQWSEYVQRFDSVLKPQGIGHYFDLSFVLGSQTPYVLTVVLALCLVLGISRRSPFGYGAALMIMHVLYVARHSQGKASHVAHCIGLSLLALTLGAALFRRSSAPFQRFVWGCLIFFFGLSYVLAGICKLRYTGLGWPRGSHLVLWIAERELDSRAASGGFAPNVLQRLILEHHQLGTLTLAFGLATELLAFLVWFERFRPWMFTGLIAMHVGIGVTMNIYFTYNVTLLVMLGYPWWRLIDWLLRRVSASSAEPLLH